MKSIHDFPTVLVARDPIDFRKGRKSLALWIQDMMNEKPMDGTLYVFFNRRKDCVKCVYWDGCGFALWEKGLEKERFVVPQGTLPEKIVLTTQQVAWLLSGVDIWELKTHKKVEYSLV